jgi:hypothetical protein
MKSIIGVILAGVLFFGIIFYLSPRFMPESSFYNFKRLAEKGTMATKPGSEAKSNYYLYLLDQRYKELDWVATYNHDLVLSSSLRYSTTAGEAVQHIKANNLTESVKPLQDRFDKHKKKFEYHEKNAGDIGGQRGFLKDAVNYIDLYSADLKAVK